MSLETNTRERIETLLKDHRVVLFMKGNRQQPMCGFSAAATNTLRLSSLPSFANLVSIGFSQTIGRVSKIKSRNIINKNKPPKAAIMAWASIK